MADLKDAIVALGGFDEAVGFGERGGDGFFDEHVEAGLEERTADFGVGDGGNGEDSGVGVADDVTVVGGGDGSARSGVFAGAFEVGVDDVGELGARVFGDNSDVVLAEGACANDGCADRFLPLLPVYNRAGPILRALALPRAWWSSVMMFLVHGLVVATWVSRIPAVQASLGLSNGALGLALLGAATGSVLAIPLCGWLVTRFGSRPVTWVSTAGFCVAPIPAAFATDVFTLASALFVLGAFAATMDVSMNVQAVEVERALGRPTMSRFHAMFSIGGMLGAALGGALASRGVGPLWHFAWAGAAFFALAMGFAPRLMASPPHEEDHALPLRGMPAALIAVSGIAFCLLVSEGAMADWTAVYLRQTLGAGPGTAAAGYAVFSAAMAGFRLAGDAITTRLGRARTVRTGSLVAAAGVLCAAVAPSVAWAMPGFALAGAGCSVVVPLAFGAGGRVKGVAPGAGVATVTGLGYIGFLVGPPSIGFTAQALNLRFGLGIVVAMCLIAAALGGFVE